MIVTPTWTVPPVSKLAAGETHVWAIPLTASAETVDRLFLFLDPDERDRARRYVHVPSRRQFIITRARLRQIIGQYLDREPTKITFGVSSTGKPTLPGSPLRFNVSHSHGMGLLAFSQHLEVGVDVEHVRTCPMHLEMASRYFSPGEAVALRSLPIPNRERAFFEVWTRKEAFLKATGLGLSHGLERFEVSVPPDEPARILHIDGDANAGASWSLVALIPSSEHVGTLAIQAKNQTVQLWRWDE